VEIAPFGLLDSPHGTTHVDLATIENQISIGWSGTLVSRTHCCADGVGNCIRIAGHACGSSAASPFAGGGPALIKLLGFIGLSQSLICSFETIGFKTKEPNPIIGIQLFEVVRAFIQIIHCTFHSRIHSRWSMPLPPALHRSYLGLPFEEPQAFRLLQLPVLPCISCPR